MRVYLRENKRMLYILLIAVVVMSAPLYTDFILFGADLDASLGRIKTVSEALFRVFPIRIGPLPKSEFGYNATVFSADVFYLLPGILFRLGVSLELAYKYTIIIFNILTALISYAAYEYISEDKYAGLTAAFVYMLCPARIYSIYIAGNLSEMFGWSFIPLVLAGLYAMYERGDGRKAFWALLAGYSLLLLSSTVYFTGVAILSAILFAVRFRENIRRDRLCFHGRLFAAFMGVNMWYLLPMLLRLRDAQAVAAMLTEHMGNYGVFISQYFKVFEFGGTASDTWISGTSYASAVGPGFSTMLIIIIYLILRFVFVEKAGAADRMLLYGGVFMLFSSSIMPWDVLQNKNLLFSIILAFIGTPAKLCVLADALLICTMALILSEASKKLEDNRYLYLNGGVCLLTLILSQFYIGRIMTSRLFLRGEAILDNADVGYALITSESKLWRISEMVTIIAILCIIAVVFMKKRGKHNEA